MASGASTFESLALALRLAGAFCEFIDIQAGNQNALSSNFNVPISVL